MTHSWENVELTNGQVDTNNNVSRGPFIGWESSNLAPFDLQWMETMLKHKKVSDILWGIDYLENILPLSVSSRVHVNSKNVFVLEEKHLLFNPLMQNVLKWSNTKILKILQQMLSDHYQTLYIEGLILPCCNLIDI